MSNTLTSSEHRIVKHVRQARTTEPVHTTVTGAATAQAYARLQSATWQTANTLDSDNPPHNWEQSGFSDRYDACMYCGDFDVATMRQHAYAGAACYSVKIPDDAQTGDPCNIEEVRLSAFGDRWLNGGAIVGMYITDSATPPAAWTDLVNNADVETAPIMSVVPSNSGTDSQAAVALTPAAPIAVDAYLHIVIRLADYLTHRGAWIEGSALIASHSIEVDYSRVVTPDAIVEPAVATFLAPVHRFAPTWPTEWPAIHSAFFDNTLPVGSRFWNGLGRFAASSSRVSNPDSEYSSLIGYAGFTGAPLAGSCIGSAQAFLTDTGYPRAITGVRLPAMDAPASGIVVRVVAYVAKTYNSSTLHQLVGAEAEAFWQGRATSITHINPPGSHATTPLDPWTQSCTPLFALSIDQAYPDNQLWPVSYNSTGLMFIVLAWSIETFTKTMGAGPHQWIWNPTSITLTT